MRSALKLGLLGACILGFLTWSFTGSLSLAKSPSKAHGKHSKTKDIDLLQREQMVNISRQLGVTCNYCHDMNNLKDRSMHTWKVAHEHIQIVKLLNQKGFKGSKGPRADCYMCHRGKTMPDYKEPSVGH